MPGNQHTRTVTRFPGPFEAGPANSGVAEARRRLRLPGQSFQILKMLLERPGELVHPRRAAHCTMVTSDTFVDFEHGLHAGVNRLREALGDSADSPRLIETLPRRGYRFIGAITPPISVPQPLEGESATLPAAVETNHATAARPLWLRVGVWVLAAAAVALTVAFIYPRSRPRTAPVTLSPIPFTTYEGTETMPSLSPDGSRIAFAWDGDPPPGPKGFDLYVKVIGSENLLRLTRRPSASWIASAWSPDGTQIAFHRISGSDTGVYVVPALGGPERKLRSTRMSNRIGAPIDWSRDGKWIAFQDMLPPDNFTRLHLLSFETLESRQIPHATECLLEESPAFSHDGKQLAYTCVQNMEHRESEVYTVATSAGQPKQIRTPGNTLAGWGPTLGLAWTADDKKLIFPGQLDAAGAGGAVRIDGLDARRWLSSSNSARTERGLADALHQGRQARLRHLLPTTSTSGGKTCCILNLLPQS